MSEREAWVWLIETAAWKATKRRTAKGEEVAIERGQLHTSLRALGTVFGWGKNKVNRFLGRLADHAMIGTASDPNGLTVTICNYEKYQTPAQKAGTLTGTVAGQSRDTQEQRKQDSASYEAAVPADPAKQLFDLGVQVLTSTGTPEGQARSLVGRWRKEFGTGDTMAALLDAKARGITQPVEWIPKKLRGSTPSPTGYLAEVARRHERRAA